MDIHMQPESFLQNITANSTCSNPTCGSGALAAITHHRKPHIAIAPRAGLPTPCGSGAFAPMGVQRLPGVIANKARQSINKLKLAPHR